jgi:hypothetical protein
MHKVTLFPLGNADSCLIELDGGKKLLFDYAAMRDGQKENDLRIDLAAVLSQILGKQDFFDVVAFTHRDNDHVCRSADFFYLEHAQKYQGDGRIKINELWVPAAFIVETNLEGDARILQAEARYRLRQGTGIRIFSRPEVLQDWFVSEDLTLNDYKHLISDAGTLIPGFSKADQGIEFFVHSPFAAHLDDGAVIDCNTSSLVVQATFVSGDLETYLLLAADAPSQTLADIVTSTKAHKNETRLLWDIFKLPHHCSYLSLSEEKGTDITQPIPEVHWLFEQGREKGIIVSTSDPIPPDDTDQPPHRQAAKYCQERVDDINGEFVVTMQHPTAEHPEPLVITIDNSGATLKKQMTRSSVLITSRPAPRAG